MLHAVDRVDPLAIVHLLVSLVHITLVRVNASELGGAPHLVSVELVRASQLVAVGLTINTVVEGVTSFKAQFLVPALLLVVSHSEEFDV